MYSCDTCNREYSVYMLKDEVWKQLKLDTRYPCILCIEKVLQRKLTHQDFDASLAGKEWSFIFQQIGR